MGETNPRGPAGWARQSPDQNHPQPMQDSPSSPFPANEFWSTVQQRWDIGLSQAAQAQSEKVIW